jgi:hypothetical protein
MFAHGSVLLKTIPNATLVPIDAVVTKGEIHSVFYIEGEVAKEVSVTTGLQKGDWIQVIGLPANVRVVIAGQDKLRAGQKVLVKATNATAKKESGTTPEG